MLGEVFQRFVQRSPISVMVRGTLERVLGAEQLNQFYARTANNQYTRELLFSTVYELMSDVVFRHQPSVRAAYQARARDIKPPWRRCTTNSMDWRPTRPQSSSGIVRRNSLP